MEKKVAISTTTISDVTEKQDKADFNHKNEKNANEMNERKYIDLLFDISEQVKLFYETPAIFLLRKDYSDTIFDAMCTIRKALAESRKYTVIETIVDAHIAWLKSVEELEKYSKRIKEISREEVCEAIIYTIDAVAHRLKYYKRYTEQHKKPLSNIDLINLSADLEIVEEMHTDIITALMEKLKCFRNVVCESVFITQVKDALDELLHWHDKIYDVFSFLLSKYMNFNVEHLNSDLTKTLQNFVDNLKVSDSPSVQKILEDFKSKGRELSQLVRGTTGHSLEICKVVEKITILNDRINRLESTSAAVMALKNKKQYLENRLESLEKLKTTILEINQGAHLHFEDEAENETCPCEDFFHLRIFNHLLPKEEREQLISELCILWDLALFGEKTRKSFVAILSATDIKEEFTDELGTYYIDEYGRKIYKKENEETLYQLNEYDELVPVNDCENRIYYYDKCGRYYLDTKTKGRIYKANETASEYVMDYSGNLLKIKEVRDGVTYYFDDYGRYYINDEGKNIYREIDSASEYEHDGMGNLVRIRKHLETFDNCPGEINVTSDFKYITKNVGLALRVCIANVILIQPSDPVKYLAEILMKYRQNIELRDKWARDKDKLDLERQIYAEDLAAKERAKALSEVDGVSEASYDTNLLMYNTVPPTVITDSELSK